MTKKNSCDLGMAATQQGASATLGCLIQTSVPLRVANVPSSNVVCAVSL